LNIFQCFLRSFFNPVFNYSKMQKSRLEAFSDGVLAIIITIMVLELKVPHGEEWSDLQNLMPKFISYILSFLYIGIYWGNHHHLVHTASKVTSYIMLANLNLLFWLSLIPFTTGWMGESHFAKIPVALYSANLLLAGTAYFILQKAIEKTVVPDDKMTKALQRLSYKGIISQIAYAASILLAFASPITSVTISFIIAIIWLIPDKGIEKAMH
jgi:uncharacterized membrane protein